MSHSTKALSIVLVVLALTSTSCTESDVAVTGQSVADKPATWLEGKVATDENALVSARVNFLCLPKANDLESELKSELPGDANVTFVRIHVRENYSVGWLLESTAQEQDRTSVLAVLRSLGDFYELNTTDVSQIKLATLERLRSGEARIENIGIRAPAVALLAWSKRSSRIREVEDALSPAHPRSDLVDCK